MAKLRSTRETVKELIMKSQEGWFNDGKSDKWTHWAVSKDGDNFQFYKDSTPIAKEKVEPIVMPFSGEQKIIGGHDHKWSISNTAWWVVNNLDDVLEEFDVTREGLVLTFNDPEFETLFLLRYV